MEADPSLIKKIADFDNSAETKCKKQIAVPVLGLAGCHSYPRDTAESFVKWSSAGLLHSPAEIIKPLDFKKFYISSDGSHTHGIRAGFTQLQFFRTHKLQKNSIIYNLCATQQHQKLPNNLPKTDQNRPLQTPYDQPTPEPSRTSQHSATEGFWRRLAA